MHQSRVIETYVEATEDLDAVVYDELIANAQSYNQWLYESGHKLGLSEDEKTAYETQLTISGTDVMAYIEIPEIDIYLPIYHGTDEAVLQVAAGHLEGSSLPVGGESTHCVISGHSGLTSAKLFTDLNELEVGDTFMIHTLDETLTYEVDQILTVLPTETEALQIEEGKDLCTLLTCTPYGINTHRLLVRGHRVENAEQTSAESENENIVEWIDILPWLAIPILCILLLVVLLKSRRGRRRKRRARKRRRKRK